MDGRSAPERTCVGCRRRARKHSLIRVVRSPGGEVQLDPTGKQPGRGAYIHPTSTCLAAGLERGSIARALRTRLEAAQAATLLNEASMTLEERA